MAEQQPGAFEQKMSRLEAIVRELESGSVDLDRAVVLFKEGKALARECEALLKIAQENVERAMASADSGAERDER
ncbi:MAG: exodeoxyribonuclease VII small subunit [Vulcanimicrobiaceae bacterium]